MDITLNTNKQLNGSDWTQLWTEALQAAADLPHETPNYDQIHSELQGLADDIAHNPEKYAGKTIADIDAMVEQIKAGGSVDPKDPIQKDIDQASHDIDELEKEIASDRDQLNDLMTKIKTLQDEISRLNSDPLLKDKAQKDLNAALAEYNNADGMLKTANDSLAKAKETLTDLKNLADTAHPPYTEDVLKQAASDLNTIQSKCDTTQLKTTIQNCSNAVDKVRDDLGDSPVKIVGDAAYLDLWSLRGYADDKSMTDAIIQKMKAAGVNHVYIAFEQLNDPIWFDKYQDLLKYAIGDAKNNNMKVDLSFGGEQSSSSTPVLTPTEMVQKIKDFGLDGIDYDCEGGSTVNTKYFGEVHKLLEGKGIRMTLTVEGGFSPDADLKNCFDDINLMLYGPTHYVTDEWVGKWVNWAKSENFPLQNLHVGFTDKSNFYEGDKSQGANAADIYLAVLKDLGLSKDDLGNVFWWADNANWDHCSKEMQDFNKEFQG